MSTFYSEFSEERGEALPHLHFVDGGGPGISAEDFDPHQPWEIDTPLLLRITVSLSDHHRETIFSGHVLPGRADCILRVRTPRSKEGYYHKIFIKRHNDRKFELKVFWSNGDSIQMYCRQLQSMDEENTMIKQETPQGLSVEILAPGQAVWPVWEWPLGMNMVERFRDNESGFFYSGNYRDLNPRDRRFEFSLFLAGREVFRVPIVNPAKPNQTIGCKHIDDDGFKTVATVTYNEQNSGDCLDLYVNRFDNTFQMPTKVVYCLQHLYLDGPEPQHRIQQDLLGGYLSFRLERVF